MKLHFIANTIKRAIKPNAGRRTSLIKIDTHLLKTIYNSILFIIVISVNKGFESKE